MQTLVTGIHHVSIVVTDLEQSRRFTRKCSVCARFRPPHSISLSCEYDLGTQHIHLVPRETADAPGARHFALHVGDAAAARQHFANFGVPTRETTPIPGCDRFFVHDPDGNPIGIMRWFRPYRPETASVRPKPLRPRLQSVSSLR